MNTIYSSTMAAPVVAVGLALAGAAAADPSGEPYGWCAGRLAEGSAWDTAWSAGTIYKNEAHPVLQELALQGQLQLQYADGSDASGQFGSADLPPAAGWGNVEVRRFRLGLRAKLWHKLKFHSILDLNPEFSPTVYKDIAEAYFTYSFADACAVSLGKTELKFSREQAISSREILTFERSNLVNMFYGGELTGAWVSGKGIAGGWLYELGVFGGDRHDEWTDFDGGAMILAKAGYDYTKLTPFKSAVVEVHYLHNTNPGWTEGGLASPKYSDCVTVSNDLTAGRFGLLTELFWGDGDPGRRDVWGVSVLPSWYLTKQLQVVGLFELAGSHGDNGITLPTRYEAKAAGTGDRAGELLASGYAGLNYYLHGHKLKLMSGVKYTYLDGGSKGGDFNGWTWLAGMRMAF